MLPRKGNNYILIFVDYNLLKSDIWNVFLLFTETLNLGSIFTTFFTSKFFNFRCKMWVISECIKNSLSSFLLMLTTERDHVLLIQPYFSIKSRSCKLYAPVTCEKAEILYNKSNLAFFKEENKIFWVSI